MIDDSLIKGPLLSSILLHHIVFGGILVKALTVLSMGNLQMTLAFRERKINIALYCPQHLDIDKILAFHIQRIL